MMKEKTSALYSKYVIDGIRQELRPSEMLDECLSLGSLHFSPFRYPEEIEDFDEIIDEKLDPAPRISSYEEQKAGEYLSKIFRSDPSRRKFPTRTSSQFTKFLIDKALLDTIWKKGSFSLDDLELKLEWKWNDAQMGNMAAFYESAKAAGDYIDNLGLKISDYDYKSAKTCILEISTKLEDDTNTVNEGIEDEGEENSSRTFISKSHKLSRQLVPEESSWIIYIPFDTCKYKLGSSFLDEVMGVDGGAAPEIDDADYFIDCYEVVRELVEDSIILSGSTVSDGGLLPALKRMCSSKAGAHICLSDLKKATGQNDAVSLLFSEVPGAIIQISDNDYDYLDAELLLQDIVYFPLGHPDTENGRISIETSDKTGIQTILEALLRNQSKEGED